MIDNGQLLAISEWLGRPSNFLLLDGRYLLLELVLVANRTWSKNGLVVCKQASGRQAVDHLMKVAGAFGDIKVVCLLKEKHKLSENELERLYELQGRLFVINTDGSVLRHHGTPLSAPDLPARSNSTQISIHGFDTRTYPHMNLPLKVELDLKKASALERLLGFSASSIWQTADQFPPLAWYSLPEDIDNATVVVDIEPGVSGDRWKPALVAPEGRVRSVDVPKESHWERGYPTSLVVIFDRTCPDDSAWIDAENLMLGSGADDFYKPAAPGAEPSRRSGELNREIRQGLANALAGEPAAHIATIKVFWFADTVGNDIAEPDNVELAVQQCGRVGDLSRPLTQEELKDRVSLLTYSPGLDVWDPLEAALQNGLDALDRERSERPAILIIGNSPPTYPADEGSPFRRIGTVLGRTSYRAQSSGWLIQLTRCREASIPIVYLFLTQQSGEVNQFSERFQLLQNAVREALQSCMPVVSVRATAGEVEEGIKKAIRHLAYQPNPVSKIRIVKVMQ